jgi:hypothetical protein
MDSDLEKRRELVFTAEPADQENRALTLLEGLPNLKIARSDKPHTLEVSYNLKDYTLSGLEQALELEGFSLDHSFLHQISRNIIYYCEDTARHNMEIPSHITKKNEKDVFVEVGAHHMHREHAGIPPDMREFE